MLRSFATWLAKRTGVLPADEPAQPRRADGQESWADALADGGQRCLAGEARSVA